MTSDDISTQLARPFDVGELKFFCVAMTKDKSKGKVGSYIDARAVMDRLDEVVGWGAWSTEYEVIDPAMKAVRCTLTVNGVRKADVGYPNEGKDADNADKEPYKAAYSDALKRAAVQFGIGRYIYSLELERDWLPIDEQGRFKEQPRLKGQPAPAPKAADPASIAPAEAAPGRNYDASELLTLMGEFNVTKEDLIKITGASSNGNPQVSKWLSMNQGKTVNNLISRAVDAKQAVTA